MLQPNKNFNPVRNFRETFKFLRKSFQTTNIISNGIKSRKTIAGILLLIILLSSVSFYPRKAEAETPVADWIMRITSASGWASMIAEYAKEAYDKALDIATAFFRKMILDMIVEEIVAWISGEGTSAFDTGDWGQFFEEAAQQHGGIELEKITGPGVMQQLCDGDWAGQVRLILQPSKKFAQKARCTLRDIGVNYNDFIEDFNKGGWAAWIKISEDNNNPYRYFLSAVDEKLAKETQKKLSLEKELTASGGFLSIRNCVQISCQTRQTRLRIESPTPGASQEAEFEGGSPTREETGKWKENEIPNENGTPCTCEKWETETPGKIMADTLTKTVFKDIEWLQNNQEWTNYVVAIGDAIVKRLTKEGVKAIKSAVPRGSPTSVSTELTSQADYTAPLTSAKIIDPWRVKLTANEPGKTYYSLDGSNPSHYRSLEYKGASLTIINSTALNAATAQLKWMSIDDNFNKEDSRSLPAFLRSPFNYSFLTSYLASQNTSIPDEIKNALIKFFGDEENGKEAAKISQEIFIPVNLRLDLKNLLKIEDLRIQTGRPSLLNAGQRGQLDAILATYDDFNPANDGKLTDFIATLKTIKQAGIIFLADLQTNGEEIRNRRDNLKTVLSYLNGVIAGLEACSKARAAAVIKTGETAEEFAIRIAAEFAACQKNAQAGFPVDLAGLSSALATDSLFNELKNKTDKVILERSLFTVDSAGNWTNPTAALTPADTEHVAILSVNPSTGKQTAIFYKQTSWAAAGAERSTALGQARANQINGFYYKQAFVIPPSPDFGTQIWYGAIDAANKPTEEPVTPEFNGSFTGLPPITNLVNPVAEIKPIVKDSGGYFVLDPSSSIDVDATPYISGYEWDFINETSATATPRYDFEIFDLNRDGVFETKQCLYNFYLNEATQGTKFAVTGLSSDSTNPYYVNNGNTPKAGDISQRYFEASQSSPFNNAPNVSPLELNLLPICFKMTRTEIRHYENTYQNSNDGFISGRTISASEFNGHSVAEQQGEKFGITGTTYKKIFKETVLISTGAYEDMKIVDANNGIIKVKFTAGSGPITVNLRVTDDEGLTAAARPVVLNP